MNYISRSNRTKTIRARYILFLGIIFVTSSSFIIRYADQDPYLLAFGRVLLTGLISLIVSFIIPVEINADSSDIKYNIGIRNPITKKLFIILSGFSLATHFGWWFASLSLIPISTSLSLTNTAPVWVGIFSFILYRDNIRKNHIIAVIFVIFGAIILFMENPHLKIAQTQGIILATGSAVGFAIYLLIAKEFVRFYGIWRYFGLVNISSAFFLFIWIVIQGKIRYLLSLELWMWSIPLAIFPGMLGHAIYNWSMDKLHQIDVAVSTLGEPILGTIFAFIIFKEYLSAYQIMGIIALLSAILLTLKSDRSE